MHRRCEATPLTDSISLTWRGAFTSREANLLHADAFETRIFADEEWDWCDQVNNHSLGWVTARSRETLVGFVNVISDGFVHAWIQDVMVAPSAQRGGIGVALVHAARDAATEAGCEWLRVDFDDEHSRFYIDSCGLEPARAGLMDLT